MLKRFVFDTNVLISAFLARHTLPFQALTQAMAQGIVLRSSETDAELIAVLDRPKFRRYLSVEEAKALVTSYQNVCEHLQNIPPLKACRDPKDDHFLSLAVYGQASVLITGDQDLLVLHPFSGVSVMTPQAFLVGA